MGKAEDKKAAYAVIKKTKAQLDKLQSAYDKKYKSTKRINVRAKGHTFERFVASCMRAVGYTKAHRQLEFQINNAHGIDIAETGRYKIQCKKTKTYVPMNTIEEVKGKDGDVAVLIAAGDTEPPLVTMYLADWLELVSNNIHDHNTFMCGGKTGLSLINEVKKGLHSSKE